MDSERVFASYWQFLFIYSFIPLVNTFFSFSFKATLLHLLWKAKGTMSGAGFRGSGFVLLAGWTGTPLSPAPGQVWAGFSLSSGQDLLLLCGLGWQEMDGSCMKAKVHPFLVLSPGEHWGHSCPSCARERLSPELWWALTFLCLWFFFPLSLVIDICLFWALFACPALVGSPEQCSISMSAGLRVRNITHARWFMPARLQIVSSVISAQPCSMTQALGAVLHSQTSILSQPRENSRASFHEVLGWQTY